MKYPKNDDKTLELLMPWAEFSACETFDFGAQIGIMAEVGPFRQAVKLHVPRYIVQPVYGEGDYGWDDCKHCGESHFVDDREVIVPGVPNPEFGRSFTIKEKKEAATQLLDWFKNRARECRKYLKKAEERGW